MSEDIKASGDKTWQRSNKKSVEFASDYDSDSSNASTNTYTKVFVSSPPTTASTVPLNDENEEEKIKQEHPDTEKVNEVNEREVEHTLVNKFSEDPYRAKIKERILKLKEKAAEESSNLATQFQNVTFKSVPSTSKKLYLSHIKDVLKREEDNLEIELKKYNHIKEERKNNRCNGNMETSEMSEEKTTEFFTRLWEPETGKSDDETRNEVSGKKFIRSSKWKTDIIVLDYLGLGKLIDEPTEYVEATPNKFKYKDGILFVPNNYLEGASALDKRKEYYEELVNEGFHVPDGTYFSKINENNWKHFQRLLGNEGKTVDDLDECLLQPSRPLVCGIHRPFQYDQDVRGGYYIEKAPALIMKKGKHKATKLAADTNYVMELEVGTISFAHHPLFSREHVLATKVEKLIADYTSNLFHERVICLFKQMHALRSSKNNILKLFSAEKNSQAIDIHRKKFNGYYKRLMETREKIKIEVKNELFYREKIFQTWNDLERLRQMQNFNSTTVKVVTVESEINLAVNLQEEIERQIEDILEEMRLTRSESEENENVGDLATEEIDEIKQNVLDVMGKCAQMFTNDKSFRIQIEHMPITTDNNVTDKRELARRTMVSQCLLSLDIYFNELLICSTTWYNMSVNFKVHVNKAFSFRIEEVPENLIIHVHTRLSSSGKLFENSLISKIYLPIPHSDTPMKDSVVENYEFACSEIIKFEEDNSAVGCGTPFKIFDADSLSTSLLTTATLNYRTGWATNDILILSPPADLFPPRCNAATNNPIMAQIRNSMLRDMESNSMDPNDPNIISIINALEKTERRELVEMDVNFVIMTSPFAFEPTEKEDESSELDNRLKLLSLRQKYEYEFATMKAIPIRPQQIPRDFFKIYEKRLSNPGLPFDGLGLCQIEIRRGWAAHSAKLLYDGILKRCLLLQQHRSTNDVVHEEKIPDIRVEKEKSNPNFLNFTTNSDISMTFAKMFQPRRPLRPRRKTRKRIPVTGLSGQEVKIIVHINRAMDVPTRKNTDLKMTDNKKSNIHYIPVRPFVDVSFKGQTQRTTTATGANPTWNQDLKFSLLSPNTAYFYLSTMRSFEETLYIHLYDEVATDVLEDERKRTSTFHQRIERNWLGSLQFPFSTLYLNNQIEGTFQLNSPPHLLGYERATHSTDIDESSSMSGEIQHPTYLTLFIIVQPLLSLPHPIIEQLNCTENRTLEEHLCKWAAAVSKKFPKRKVKTFVADDQGSSVCVTRFIRPIKPPEIIIEDTDIANVIARYVSLIPLTTTGSLIFGNINMWLTSQNMMRMLCGERDDHAVLLACYFTHIGLQCWVLLGDGIPDGFSAFVLTFHEVPMEAKPIYKVWDPLNGRSYLHLDPLSPLQTVHCLISDKNIWVNTQSSICVRRINFELYRKRDWWPAFNETVTCPPIDSSLQSANIDYHETSLAEVHLLQERIEKQLREAIPKWRYLSKTAWNRHCVNALRKLLPIMERYSCGVYYPGDDHLADLQQIRSCYKVSGFPICQAFSNINAIIEAVKSTGVHCNDAPDVEFAVAVYVHPYPNDILAVWVYAVSLISRR